MDFTETPHAEDMMMEIGSLIEEYLIRGIDPRVVVEIMTTIIEDLELENGDD